MEDTAESLPEGSATQGMYGGTMGDLSASDVRRGFEVIGDGTTNRPENLPREGDDEILPKTQEPGGFAKRPGGWER